MASRWAARGAFCALLMMLLVIVSSCGSPSRQASGVSAPSTPSTPSSPDPSPSSVPAPSLPPEPAAPVQPKLGPSPVKDAASSNQPALSAEALKLLARADEKVKGYSFIYAAPPDNLARDTYFVKGDKVKVQVFDRGWFKKEDHMTVVYLDGAKKSAVGYCDDPRVTYCPDPSKRFQVSYAEYGIKMPYEWLKEIKFGKLTPGDKVYDRMTQIITYNQGDEKIEQWIDEFSGLPVKVRVTGSSGPRIYEFRHLTVNDVSDAIFSKMP